MSKRRIPVVVCREHGRTKAYEWKVKRVGEHGRKVTRKVRRCRLCCILSHKAWLLFKADTEKLKKYAREWVDENRDKVRKYHAAYTRKWRRWRRPHYLAKRRAWRKKYVLRERAKERARYYARKEAKAKGKIAA